MTTDKRKENAERAERIVNRALVTLAAALERGHSEGLQRHLEAMARFHRYSISNLMLIVGQKPEARHVEGFRTWQKLGRRVRKGEKGILIRAPYSVRRTKNDAGEKDDETFVGFKAAYVFDISQTEGDELATFGIASGEPGANIDALKDFAESRDIELRYEEVLAAHGMSHGGRITLRKGLSPAEEFTTLVHELGHELMHKDEEKRTRKVAETEAEAVAFVVSHAAGLDAVQASADYINLYRGDSATLWGSLERIQKASGELIRCLNVGESYRQAA